MKRRYCTVDVFTDVAFGGNPLAVVLDAEGLTTAQMQAVAAEFGYSETTFALPPPDASHDATVRIFTPNAELAFAGHPNIGTAFVLASQAGAVPERLVFHGGAGSVALAVLQEGGLVRGAALTAPQSLRRGREVGVDGVAACLSLTESDICVLRHAPVVASVGMPFVFVELVSRAALTRAAVDVAAHRALLPIDGANGIYLYVRDGVDTLHARMFAPLMGVDEDPATGSATAAVAALLAAVDGREPRLLVHQGDDMGRPSLLRARAHGDGDGIVAHVGGDCVMMMQGSFVLAGDAAATGTT